MSKPTRTTYAELQKAYDHFNRSLFKDELPPCLITLQRERRTYGYFSGDRWRNADGETTDEIALNPEHFSSRSIEEVLSTLVHEMVHLWQHHFGRPGRRRYHNKEWAVKMEAVGLGPSDTGRPGGNLTGESMSHYIIKDGPYVKSAARLVEAGFELSWVDRVGGTRRKKTKVFRVKYSCPKCGVNAWAKPGVKLVCGFCQKGLVAIQTQASF